MSPDLRYVSVIQTIRAQHACVSPACEETVLGPASLEERGDRRRPRYVLTNSLYLRSQSDNDRSARGCTLICAQNFGMEPSNRTSYQVDQVPNLELNAKETEVFNQKIDVHGYALSWWGSRVKSCRPWQEARTHALAETQSSTASLMPTISTNVVHLVRAGRCW
jgi:hypothetical protein